MDDLRDSIARARREAGWASAHWAERFLAELEFGKALCGLHPEHAPEWEKLLRAAAGGVSAATSAGAAALAAAIQEAEIGLAPIADAAKRYTVHCVGHAHIDMNWMWSWPETVAVTNDTFSTVLRLMDEYPEFRFSQSQASVYAIVERHNPEMLARIAERVREGRWEVTASHWVEGDKNLVSGEALTRHLLYTRAYMRELFGLEPEDVPVDWSPDTFGHAATVPTYLVRGGIKYLYLHRPGTVGPERPGAFWWSAPDGSRVLVRNDMAVGYNARITPVIGSYVAGFARQTGCRDYMLVYGIGDHGGGPTRRDVLMGLEMNSWPVFPRVEFSSARAFFERLEKSGDALPTLACELNTEFTGCYTSQSLIKKANRFAEARLVDAETFSALAHAAAGSEYPGERFVEGWRDTLFSHFHDILPGSGVHDTRTYTHGLWQKTMASTGMAETRALRALVARVDTSTASEAGPPAPPSRVASALGAGVGFGSAGGSMSAAERGAGQGERPFVVFNPCSWDRAEVVEVAVWDNAPTGATTPLKDRDFRVRSASGDVLPAQKLGSGHYWGHEYVRLAFPVSAAGLGYSTCVVGEGRGPEGRPGAWQTGRGHHCRYAMVERPSEGLENDLVRVELDPTNGGIRSLLDKRSGLTLISPERPAPPLEFGVERPHGMTAWQIEHSGPTEIPAAAAITREADGPYKASIAVSLRVRSSEFKLTYELRQGDPCLYLGIKGTWFERGTPDTGVPVLRASFPLALTGARARYEVPFGAVDRADTSGLEVPALRWAQVSGLAGGKPAGCLLFNDCKHGHSLEGSTLRLSLIRASYDPDPLPEIGEHEIRLGLLPFSGDLPVADAVRAGRGFSHALRPVGTGAHQGDLAPAGRFLSVSPQSVVLSALKKAEDSDALVLRLFETAGNPATARITLEKSLGALAGAREVDLMERPLENGAAEVAGPTVSVEVPALGLVSVMIEPKRPGRD